MEDQLMTMNEDMAQQSLEMGELTPEEAKAAMGFSNRIAEDMFTMQNPPMEQDQEMVETEDQPIEEGEEETKEVEEPEEKEELEVDTEKIVKDEVKKQLKDIVREELKNMLGEDEEE